MPTSLIIEDDIDAAEILAALCKERGYEAIQCHTGEAGLKTAREQRPDLVFLDLMLPDLDGYQVCEKLKLDRATNPIPVVMVTALTTHANVLDGYRVGADAYVPKPYTPDEIDKAIEAALQHQQRMAGNQIETAFRCDMASQVANLQNVNDLFGALLQHSNLSAKEANQLRTAFQEIGQNAIEWGNRFDPNKAVKVSCRLFDDRVEIDVADEGEGFDPASLPHAYDGGDDPTMHFSVRNLLGLREGGFGLLIAKGLLDEVMYNDRGNAVTLVKRCSAKKA